MTRDIERSQESGVEERRGRRLRPRHFKYFVASNIGLVAAAWLLLRAWLEWAIALALVLTIVEVVAIALAAGKQ